MIKKIFVTLILCFTMGVLPVHATGNMDPLLKILIKKGVLTRQEAMEVQKEANEMGTNEADGVTSSSGLPHELKGLKNVKLGVLAYFDYSIGKEPLSGNQASSFSRFSITRGYVTLKKKINPFLGARVTTDIHRDSTGDYKIRLKYMYAELKPRDFGFFTDMKAEVGQGHIPWLDFEEHVNPYRSQGTMAIERAGVFNSADVGISIRGNFGGELDDPEALVGNTHYAGRFGTWHIGVYNGSGYHTSEHNSNKVVEGRITLRPFPDVVPGLQFSYLGMAGEGNTDYNGSYADYYVNLGMVSFQHPRFILTGQYFQTTGNAKGTWVKTDTSGNIVSDLKTRCYSFFGNVRLPVLNDRLNMFGRYDHFNPDVNGDISSNAAYKMYIGGLAYDLGHENQVLLAYETTDYEVDNAGKGKAPVTGTNLGDDYKVQVVYQMHF